MDVPGLEKRAAAISDAPLRTPRFVGLRAASPRASASAKGSSRKRDTRCELALRAALRVLGVRVRGSARALPGKPDLVFVRRRVAVFCDGDFWHGRDLAARLAKLESGHNAPYWTAKIRRNVERDAQVNTALAALGWTVVRVWETDVLRDPVAAAKQVAALLAAQGASAARASSSRAIAP